MKKYLFLLLISLLVVSCSKVKVEGNVKGGSPLERIEFIEASGVATLPLVNLGVDEKGNFKGEFKAPKNGMYAMTYAGKMNFIYLKKGQTLNISGDAATFPEVYKIEGDAKKNNDFITATQKFLESYSSKLNMQLLQKNEPEFLAEIKKIHSDLEKNLDDNAEKLGADSEVIKLKKDELTTNILTFLVQYQFAHGQVTGDPSFKVSKNFIDYEKSLTENNDRMVENLPVYRNYLLNKVGKDFQAFAEKQKDKDNVTMSTIFARFLGTNKELSQKTKDYLLAFVIAKFDLNPYTSDVEKVKKVSDESIKDSEVKKDLNSAINAVFGLKKGEVAPTVNLVKLNGKSGNLESNGKPTLVMSYASWNPYIGQSTIPVLKEVVNFYKAKVNFAYVNLDDTKEQFTKTANAMLKGIPGTSYYAEGGLQSEYAKKFFIYGFKIPGFFLIDKDGKVASQTFYNLGDAKFVEAMNKISGLQAPSVNPNAQLQNDLLQQNPNADSAKTK
ncbi:TlpA family protein disulfide reductase [Epilithonimonas hispanica]|uniref:TlpA family protein disulfide reductase n=1 Tax=Epilithonimonas hispanica TaxID=358687 RepID=A0A3D9CPM0_9FLAO|nr:thioredoxin-like domain-containing protein [Epilithonimonas hispanica]REC67743.1 TlpA family protein disulfide reductase [Epilithonimonas hispanica]